MNLVFNSATVITHTNIFALYSYYYSYTLYLTLHSLYKYASVAPYLPTDPHNWSDKRGRGNKPRESVGLPPDGLWEWQGNWHVDMRGQIGKEIDKEGWEYAFDFLEVHYHCLTVLVYVM
jgi:hypothetical protein